LGRKGGVKRGLRTVPLGGRPFRAYDQNAREGKSSQQSKKKRPGGYEAGGQESLGKKKPNNIKGNQRSPQRKARVRGIFPGSINRKLREKRPMRTESKPDGLWGKKKRLGEGRIPGNCEAAAGGETSSKSP